MRFCHHTPPGPALQYYASVTANYLKGSFSTQIASLLLVTSLWELNRNNSLDYITYSRVQ